MLIFQEDGFPSLSQFWVFLDIRDMSIMEHPRGSKIRAWDVFEYGYKCICFVHTFFLFLFLFFVGFLFVCLFVFKHLYCSAQLSMSSMEKHYRNKIIIIIIE